MLKDVQTHFHQCWTSTKSCLQPAHVGSCLAMGGPWPNSGTVSAGQTCPHACVLLDRNHTSAPNKDESRMPSPAHDSLTSRCDPHTGKSSLQNLTHMAHCCSHDSSASHPLGRKSSAILAQKRPPRNRAMRIQFAPHRHTSRYAGIYEGCPHTAYYNEQTSCAA